MAEENIEQNKAEDELAPIRTYQHDVAGGLRKEGTSAISIAVQEQEKRQREEETVVREMRVSKRMVLGISLFIFVGAVAVALAIAYKSQTPTNIITPTDTLPQGLIVADTQVIFDLSGKKPIVAYRDLASAISGAQLRPGTLQEFVIGYRASSTNSSDKMFVPIKASNFFAAIGIEAPDRFIRFLDPQIMLGTYAFRTTSGFIIVKPNSYGPVFATLLEWEREMPNIFYPLLTGKPLASGNLASSSPVWEDYLYKNIDTRVLRDASDNIILLYTFMPTKDTLVIVSDLDTLSEILLRAQTPRPTLQ